MRLVRVGRLTSLTARKRGGVAGETFPKLVELMAYLRGPNGCPWDKAQDYESIKGLMLEEAYEVLDALQQKDFEAVKEELGDLLFQVVFYSRLAQEDGKFDVDAVIEGVHAKLMRRHPHVFGETRASTPEEALESWTKAKESEKAKNSNAPRNSILAGIAAGLPSTLEAYELGLRASQAGFDWPRLDDLLDKVEEEFGELREEIARQDRAKLEEELGDLLFALANLARQIRSDPESCLRAANQKFRRRFRALEEEVARRGKTVAGCTPEELDDLWERLKTREKHEPPSG